MNTRGVLHIAPIGLLMTALILLAVSSLGLGVSFASWLIKMRSIEQPIQADPLDVVNDFHNAVNDDSTHAILELFAEDAAVYDRNSTFNGRDEIRDWALHSARMSGLHLTLISSRVAGGNIFWHDMAYNGVEAHHRSYILQWMAFIQEGKIKTLSVSPLPVPDGK